MVNCYFSVSLSSGLQLNAAVEPALDLSILQTNIGAITGIDGVALTIVTSSVRIVRRAEALITVVEGAVSRLDFDFIAGLAEGLIEATGGSELLMFDCYVIIE